MAPLPPVTDPHPVLPFKDDCHCIVPVYPFNVMVVLEPVQIDGAVAVAVPPTDVGSTVIAVADRLFTQPVVPLVAIAV